MTYTPWALVIKHKSKSSIVKQFVTYWAALQCGAVISRYLHDLEYDVRFLK